jgi:hypothetical protein
MRSDWVSFWCLEVDEKNVPRQWLRSNCELLQGFQKVTDGTPADAMHATHLMDCDYFVTADKRFIEVIKKMTLIAPVKLGKPLFIKVGKEGISEEGLSVLKEVLNGSLN